MTLACAQVLLLVQLVTAAWEADRLESSAVHTS